MYWISQPQILNSPDKTGHETNTPLFPVYLHLSLISLHGFQLHSQLVRIFCVFYVYFRLCPFPFQGNSIGSPIQRCSANLPNDVRHIVSILS